MAAGFLLLNFNPKIQVKNLCTSRISNINSITSSKRRRFLRPLRSIHRHDKSNDSPPSSSSEDSTKSKHFLAEDDGIEDIIMPIAPSVLKALEEGGVGRTETLKRATATPTETPAISFKEEDHKQIYEDVQLCMPMLQKPGNLELVMLLQSMQHNLGLVVLLQLIQQFTGLNVVVPYTQFIGQKPNDGNFLEGCTASLFLVVLLRNLGGLKYERDRKGYSEELLHLVAYHYLEDQLRIEVDKKNNSRAEKLASTLADIEPVVTTFEAPELLLLHAFKSSGFTPDGRIVSYEDGFIFPGKLEGHPEEARNHLQQFIDLIGQDNIVILTKSRKDPNEAWCVIAPWTWLMGFVLPDSIYNWICGLSFLGAFVGALQFSHADPGLEPILWEPLVIPSLLLSVVGVGTGARWFVASKYDVANLIRWPAVFPCVGLGTMGAVTGYKGRLPNRSSFLNLSVASIFSSLTFSSLLVFMGYSVGSSNAFSKAVVDFHGYFLVPLDMFSYSSFFTFLLRKLSIATYAEEMGNLKFVISPISLSGLLGLNFCAFQLLPLSRSDGSRILEAILGREAKGNISMIVIILLTICFMVKNPLLCFAWWSYIGFSGQYDDLFQREEVTEPPLYGKLLGLGLVLAAFASFVPVLW
ncbi:hypothetical protein SUGI_0580550 [Cryptomeria japonica]|nr:hypothetical protein SUGI_0580550 [Cryptomeria japonica]